MSVADIVINNGGSDQTISVSDTTPMSTRAQDATAAINAAFPATPTFKVIWGFKIVAGYNDELIFAANLNGTATNVTAYIVAQDYASGAALATGVQTAMREAEAAARLPGGIRVWITVTYSETTGKFNFAWEQVQATVSQFIIRGSGGAANYTRTASSRSASSRASTSRARARAATSTGTTRSGSTASSSRSAGSGARCVSPTPPSPPSPSSGSPTRRTRRSARTSATAK